MKKKVIKKILIGTVTLVTFLFVIFIAVFIGAIVTSPKPNVSEIEWSYNIEFSVPMNGEDMSDILYEAMEEKLETENRFYEELNWYDTIEEAVKDDSKFEDANYHDYVFSREFFRLQFEDREIVFFVMPNSANKKQELITFMLFATDGDKISQPYEYQVYMPIPAMGSKRYFYDCDDAVVDYIIFELRLDRVLDNHQLQMFFGSWPDKEELESLTIAGIPLEILDEPLVLNGEEYYFWYLTDLSWCDRLQDIQWLSFTYADVIELLDIEYEPRESEQM